MTKGDDVGMETTDANILTRLVTLCYVPQTREECIDALVELEVKKWGESEREASRFLHAQKRTYGLALNSLSVREEFGFGDDVPHLRAAAKAALTKADWYELRR